MRVLAGGVAGDNLITTDAGISRTPSGAVLGGAQGAGRVAVWCFWVGVGFSCTRRQAREWARKWTCCAAPNARYVPPDHSCTPCGPWASVGNRLVKYTNHFACYTNRVNINMNMKVKGFCVGALAGGVVGGNISTADKGMTEKPFGAGVCGGGELDMSQRIMLVRQASLKQLSIYC